MDDTNQYQQTGVTPIGSDDGSQGSGLPMSGGQGTQTQSTQGDDAVVVNPEKPKIELPKLSEEEVEKFDMREFDPTLRPDLTTMSNDSLGQALGSNEGMYEGAHLTVNQQYEDILKTEIPGHETTFDEMLFKELLAGSISLMYNEKKAIIAQVPKLSQFQLDELIKILKEEKRKFAELNKKHTDELKKIEEKHENKEEKQELRQAEEQSKSKDEEEAEALLRQLRGE